MRNSQNAKSLNEAMFAGIDIGSVTSKAVLINKNEKIAAFSLIPTSYDRRRSGKSLLKVEKWK